MILDITALKNYKDIKTLQKLSISLDMDKIIILLDDTVEGSSDEFLSKLISMGIYNFTKNIDGIIKIGITPFVKDFIFSYLFSITFAVITIVTNFAISDG